MKALCRNKHCPKPGGEYKAGHKNPAQFPGYCTKKCAAETAKAFGWTEAREKRGGLTIEQTLKGRGVWSRVRKPNGVDAVLGPLEPEAAGHTYATRHMLNQDPRVQEAMQGESQALELYSPAAQAVARRFEEETLTFSLTAPTDERTLELLSDPDKPLAEAQQVIVDSDDEYKLADRLRIQLLDEADELEKTRTDGTKDLNSVKNRWDGIIVPGVKNRKAGAKVIEQTMRAYESRVKAEEDARRVEQERLIKAEQDRLLQEADKLSKRQTELKNERLKEDARRRAEELRATATSMAPTLGESGAALPDSDSNRSGRWVGSVTDTREAMESLLGVLGPEWLEMVSFSQGTLNTLAKFCKDTREVPGFKFKRDTGLRRPKNR